jgi:hypothetical protein
VHAQTGDPIVHARSRVTPTRDEHGLHEKVSGTTWAFCSRDVPGRWPLAPSARRSDAEGMLSEFAPRLAVGGMVGDGWAISTNHDQVNHHAR